MRFKNFALIIDNAYGKSLQMIIKQVLFDYQQIPITYQDLYFSFLLKSPWLVFAYQLKYYLTFKTFVGLKCKFYVRTEAKKFLTAPYRILNYAFYQAHDLNDSHFQEDCLEDQMEFNFNNFDQNEILIYKLKFIQNLKIKQIVKMTNFSYAQIRTILKSIKIKIKIQYNYW